jgi:CubicO group peptidase (beta-lactamase class C family)
MSAAVIQDGAIAWERGFGYQNVAARLRATPDTPYLIGDLTSTVSAVLMLQCVEQRRIRLDESIRNFGVTSLDPGVTARQILTHTAAGENGESFKYNSERYAELTAAIEWCAPQPYRKTVSHRILNRLAMRDSVPGTDLADPDVAIPEGLPEGLYDPDDLERYQHVLERVALPYRVDSKLRAVRTEVPRDGINAATGLVSTVRDLARFDTAIDSALLLDEETLAAAWTPVSPEGRPPQPMGMGWFVQAYRGERIVWHFGTIPNAYSSLIVKVPARRLTFVILANSDGLTAPFALAAGDVTRSLFASIFLKLAVV